MGLGVRFPPGAPARFALRAARRRMRASAPPVARSLALPHERVLTPKRGCAPRSGDPRRNLGQLAQLVRASRLHREGRRFDSYVAHQLVSSLLAPRIRLLPNLLRSRNEASLYPTNACSSRSGTARHIRGEPEGRAPCYNVFHNHSTIVMGP